MMMDSPDITLFVEFLKEQRELLFRQRNKCLELARSVKDSNQHMFMSYLNTYNGLGGMLIRVNNYLKTFDKSKKKV
jgi:hypothetical protein